MKLKNYLKQNNLLLDKPLNYFGWSDKYFENFSVRKYLTLLKNTNIDKIDSIATQRVLSIFKAACKYVPAYKDFTNKNKINPESIKTFSDFKNVPIITKENYLNNYPYKDLFWYGSMQNTTMISVSSGSTGKPYYWPRNEYLEYETAITHEIFSDVFFNISNNKTLVINAYAMGMYVAGTFTLNSFRKISKKNYELVTVSPGIEDKEVIQIIKDLGDDFDQIIIAGYPPFVKDIIDKGKSEGLNWLKYKIKFIFGAENFSEEWRTYLLNCVGYNNEKDIINNSMNTYGSADCAILGHETPVSIIIRRLISKHNLQSRIFNLNFIPTLVQYNPILRYFEMENNELIFSSQGAIPLIRYNIKDTGQIYSFNNLFSKLRKEDEHLLNNLSSSVWSKLPFLILSGRKNNTITLYGLNIYPETIRAGLEDDEIKKLVSGKFSMKTKNDNNFNQYLEITIELNDKSNISSEQEKMIRNKIIEYLKNLNFEFSKLYQKIGHKADPKIKYESRGYFNQVESKHQWIQK